VTMAPIGLVPLILMLLTRTTSISVAPSPTHPSTSLVGSASLCVVLLITRSGAIDLVNGKLAVCALGSYTWSQSAASKGNIYNTAYALNIDEKHAYTSYAYANWHGLLMRCQAS